MRSISSRSPSAAVCASSRLSYGMYEVSPSTSSVGIRTLRERRRRPRHLPVRGDDRALAVAVAETAVVVGQQVHRQLPLDELPRRRRQARSPRSGGRSPPRRRRTSGRGGRSPRRRCPTCGRIRIAGSSSTSRSTRSGAAAAVSYAIRPPKEWPSQAAGPGGAASSTSATCCSRFQGGSHGEPPCPRRSRATTWKRPDRRSASCSKCRPWLVTPCRQTSAGRRVVAPLVPGEAQVVVGGERARDELGPRRVSASLTRLQTTIPVLSIRKVPRTGAPRVSSKTP